MPKLIPDLGFASSVVNVEYPDLEINQVWLEGLSITHPWIGDLRVTLTSPSGTTVVLIDQVCNVPPGAANFSNIRLLDGANQQIGSVCPPATNVGYRPTNPLSAFKGEQSKGIWTLTVSDHQLLNTGTLQGWGLSIFFACTAVEVASFTATRARKNALVRWRVGSENGVAGFNVYRDQGGNRVRRNRTLIAPRTAGRAAYVFRDRVRDAVRYRYWLEVVRLDGSRARYGPATLR